MERKSGARDDSGGATLQRYLQEIARYPLLNHEEEKELAARIAQGDEDALRKLVEANLRFVVAYAKKYRNSNLPFLDLIHEGNLGLIQAAKKYAPFEESQDVKFITYAVWWIRQAILHYLAEQGSAFRLPQKQANMLYRMERVRALMTERNGRPPSDQELAKELEIPVDDLRVLEQASRSSISLNDPVDQVGDAELGDLLEQSIFPDTDERLLQASFTRALEDALEGLPPREREVLQLRFGLQDKKARTLREVGEILGLSRERVRQIETRALRRLRRSHLSSNLADYL